MDRDYLQEALDSFNVSGITDNGKKITIAVKEWLMRTIIYLMTRQQLCQQKKN